MRNLTTSRDPVAVLQTKFWYGGLCLELGETTAYGLEKRIEPGAFKQDEYKVWTHRNKWWRYSRGIHTPNATTRARADSLVPGSSAELDYVLWRSLQDEPLGQEAGRLLRQLRPELQSVLFEHDFRIECVARFLRKIEHRASIDALACLTILLRVNYEEGYYDRARIYGHAILRMLLILGEVFVKRKIAEELFDVYRKRIFSLVRLNGEKFLLDGYSYLDSVAILHHYACNTNFTKGRKLAWHEQVKFMRRVLNGNFGLGFNFLLIPCVGPDFDIGPPTSESILRAKQCVQLQKSILDNKGLSSIFDAVQKEKS